MAGPPSRGKISTMIGILMLGAWVIPLLGVPVGAVGLAHGLRAYRKGERETASAGIFLNSLGLLVTIINAGLSLYIFSSDNSLLDFFFSI